MAFTYMVTGGWPLRDDGGYVSPNNPDYLAWLASGHTPLPEDPPKSVNGDRVIAKLAGSEDVTFKVLGIIVGK